MRELKLHARGNLYHLKWEGGGEVPKALRGQYTSEKDAMFAASTYLATRRPKKGKANATDHTRAE